jgi:hypothetical protein
MGAIKAPVTKVAKRNYEDRPTRQFMASPAPDPATHGIDFQKKIWEHDKHYDSDVKPADRVLVDPGISLMAPRNRFAPQQMALDGFSLADVAGLSQQAWIDGPGAHRRGRPGDREIRIRRTVITVKEAQHRAPIGRRLTHLLIAGCA